MKNVMYAMLFTASLGSIAPVFAADMQGMKMGQADAGEMVSHGTGVIKSLDPKQKTVTLAHQPIKELNWPAMTMGFKVSDEKMLQGLKVGDQVTFDLKGGGAAPVVTAIRPAK